MCASKLYVYAYILSLSTFNNLHSLHCITNICIHVYICNDPAIHSMSYVNYYHIICTYNI